MTKEPQDKDDFVRARIDEAVRGQIRNIDDRRRGMRNLQRSPRGVVLDANILRGEIGALARRGHDTALVTLTKIGFLTPCAAGHVFDEIEEHAERWASEMKVRSRSRRTRPAGGPSSSRCLCLRTSRHRC